MCREPLRRAWPGAAREARGFTLIEVMIVVAMIAFLAAVALPSYQSSVSKARRADARSALVTTAQLMERYSTEHAGSGYSTATLSDACRADRGRQADERQRLLPALRSPTSPPTTFTLSAVPQGAQAADGCATFTLDERGVRGAHRHDQDGRRVLVATRCRAIRSVRPCRTLTYHRRERPLADPARR